MFQCVYLELTYTNLQQNEMKNEMSHTVKNGEVELRTGIIPIPVRLVVGYCLLLFIVTKGPPQKQKETIQKRTYFPKDPWASPQGITPCLPKVPVADIPETYGQSR